MADCREVNAGMLKDQDFAKPQAESLIAALAVMVMAAPESRASPLLGYISHDYG